MPIFAPFSVAELVERQRRDVHVDAPDLALVVLHAVDGVDGLEDVRETFVRIRLAGHEQHAFVALVDEHRVSRGDLLLRERPALRPRCCAPGTRSTCTRCRTGSTRRAGAKTTSRRP